MRYLLPSLMVLMPLCVGADTLEREHGSSTASAARGEDDIGLDSRLSTWAGPCCRVGREYIGIGAGMLGQSRMHARLHQMGFQDIKDTHDDCKTLALRAARFTNEIYQQLNDSPIGVDVSSSTKHLATLLW